MSPASAHPATSESPEATKKEVPWATPAEKAALKLAAEASSPGISQRPKLMLRMGSLRVDVL